MHFTKQERWIVGFLLGALVVNAGIRIYQQAVRQSKTRPPEVLTASDSLFLSRVAFVDSLASVSTTPDTIPAEAGPMLEQRLELKIDINAAEEDQLRHLPGIGPVMAKRIIAHRQKNGYFKSIDDLREVRGIGPVTASNLKPHIIFKPEQP